MISYARKNPEKLNYSTIGVGSGAHLVMEMLSQAADVKLTMVPYKGTSQQAADIISGVIDMTFEYPSAIMSMICAAERYFPIAVTGPSGWRTCPTCPPTFLEEQGYPGICRLTNWTSIVVPVGIPSL